ncbi:unnamed protein product [Cunninghamella echinulata]
MTISQIHVLFHVPEGFEEIATLDIKESLLPFESLILYQPYISVKPKQVEFIYFQKYVKK